MSCTEFLVSALNRDITSNILRHSTHHGVEIERDVHSWINERNKRFARWTRR